MNSITEFIYKMIIILTLCYLKLISLKATAETFSLIIYSLLLLFINMKRTLIIIVGLLIIAQSQIYGKNDIDGLVSGIFIALFRLRRLLSQSIRFAAIGHPRLSVQLRHSPRQSANRIHWYLTIRFRNLGCQFRIFALIGIRV